MDQTTPESKSPDGIKSEMGPEWIDRKQTIFHNAVTDAEEGHEDTSVDRTLKGVKTEPAIPPHGADYDVCTEGNIGMKVVRNDMDIEPDYMNNLQSRDEESKTFIDGPVPVALYASLVYHQSESNLDNKHQDLTVQTSQCLTTQRLNTKEQGVYHRIEKPYKCSTCSFSTANKKSLKRHELTHTGERPYKCSQCSYSAVVKSVLQAHQRTHTGEKPYKCTMCSYSSAHRQNLHTHERTHTIGKPYRCTMCSYRAIRREHIKVHERTHTGDKPYICTLCSFSFAQRQHLKTHERTHTGEKPYRCTMCPYSAVQKVNLQRHKQTHAAEKPDKCARIAQPHENI